MTPNPTTNATAIGSGPRADVRYDTGRADVLTGRASSPVDVTYTSRVADERPTNNRAIVDPVVTTASASGVRRSDGVR